MKNILLVFIGGGFGSVARYLLSNLFNSPSSGIPYGTFLANIIGSFVIGIILGLAAKYETLSETHMLLLATGFCGGFTTFSTFAYENHEMLKAGDLASFFAYTVGSFVLGFAAVFLAMLIVKYL